MFNDLSDTNHNIMCLVGNGFDIAALLWLNRNKEARISRDSSFGGNVLSTYPNFFKYLEFTRDDELDNKNQIYTEMKKRKEANADGDWADFEGIVGERVEKIGTITDDIRKKDAIKKLEADLLELQRAFSVFLNNLLPAEKIVEFDRLAMQNEFATRSIRGFLADINPEEEPHLSGEIYNLKKDPPNFPFLIDYGHQINFAFMDFNYTSLLDSYIELDREQFELQLSSVDTNFTFYPNPQGLFTSTPKIKDGQGIDKELVIHSRDYKSVVYPQENVPPKNCFCRVRLLTYIVHPHGIQDVPRSILFGAENVAKSMCITDGRWKFIKSILARDEEKYLNDIKKTQLFIIFGMSLGSMDGWWLSEIYKCIAGIKSDGEGDGDGERADKDIPELIIYNFWDDEKNQKIRFDTKRKFIDACIYVDDKEKATYDETVIKHIYVVNFTNKNVFLGFTEEKKFKLKDRVVIVKNGDKNAGKIGEIYDINNYEYKLRYKVKFEDGTISNLLYADHLELEK